ncbi:cytochrome P450 3A8-like [Liolophura sinensis]|uniref:cytochrome P450 3A8-like n=1 Tax=Liolophura sinensis TaxID=3198878 RepID=UPI0031594866
MFLTDVISFLPGWLLYLILFGIALYLYGIWPYFTNTVTLPGPKPTAFVGNLADLAKKGPVETDVEYVKKYGPVHLTWMGRAPFMHIADPEMVKQICIKDFSNFVNRPNAVPLSKDQKLFISIIEDDHWKFVRSVLSPAFSSGKMKGMVPLIQNCINRLHDVLSAKAKSGESFNIQPILEALSLEVISATAFAIDVDAQNKRDELFLTKAKKIFDRNVFAVAPLFIGMLFPFTIPFFEAIDWTISVKDSSKYLQEVLANSIKEKKANASGRKDLLQIMIDNSVDNLKRGTGRRRRKHGRAEIEDLKRSKKLTDLAGYKTTSSLMSFLSYNLAVYSECQEKLIQEIDDTLKGETPTYATVMNMPYLDMCVQETQRLYPAITGLHRVAKSSTIINGHYIPKGMTVKLLGYILQRDPQYWPDPETFNPERFTPEEKAKRNPYVYFPFGLGPRNCVGMRLALLETKLSIVSILQKFRLVRCPETQVPIKFRAVDHLEAENGIWVKVETRDH